MDSIERKKLQDQIKTEESILKELKDRQRADIQDLYQFEGKSLTEIKDIWGMNNEYLVYCMLWTPVKNGEAAVEFAQSITPFGLKR